MSGDVFSGGVRHSQIEHETETGRGRMGEDREKENGVALPRSSFNSLK